MGVELAVVFPIRWFGQPAPDRENRSLGNSPEQSLVDSMANSSRTRVGLGQATADAFAKEGPDVVATDLHDKDGAEQTRARPARLVDAVSAGRF
jgi:hypothetical protein